MREMLIKVREMMKEEGIDAFLVPTGDPHLSEYPASRYKDREILTGFTGSWGTAIVLMDRAYVWIDGRYIIQAHRQLENSGFEILAALDPKTPSIEQFLRDEIQSGETLAVPGLLVSEKARRNYEEALKHQGAKIVDRNFLDELWLDRPSLSSEPLFVLDECYAGKSVGEKLEEVRRILVEKGAEMAVFSSLDDVAWALNLRGHDVPENPVFYSFLVVTRREATLYLPKEKQTLELMDYLQAHGVGLRHYDEIYEDGRNCRGTTILLDDARTNTRLFRALEKGAKVIVGQSPIVGLKAIKNPVEQENLKKAYHADAIALVSYFYELTKRVERGESVSEYEAQNLLEEYRKKEELFIENSFTPISASGPNGAMMHYSAPKEGSGVLSKEDFYLIDSGGQYFTGTTDITRTLGFSKMSESMARDYTLVLKSHMALIRAIFLEQTTGNELDAIARQPLWREHMDYKCGTGHGVGFVLNVHEGPQSISRAKITTALEPGMVVTIEPGIYKEDEYGIRLENVVVVAEDGKSGDGTFYRFDPLSYIPFCRRAILSELLDREELAWLNHYHQKVYEDLRDDLSDDVREWLYEETRPIQ